MKLAVIGDSYAVDPSPSSWTSLLGRSHTVTNYSQRGISQYRLLTIIEKNIDLIRDHDGVIVCHTNPDRVYVNDEVEFATRKLPSHPHADLLASDGLDSPDSQWKNIAKNYYKIFFNLDQQELYHRFIVQRIQDLMRSTLCIHCSGFNLDNIMIENFSKLAKQYPGKINHMNVAGNQAVFEFVYDLIKKGQQCDI